MSSRTTFSALKYDSIHEYVPGLDTDYEHAREAQAGKPVPQREITGREARATDSAFRISHSAFLFLLFCLPLLLGGCISPISVNRANPRTVHRLLTGNVLSNGELSGAAQNVLRRWDLTAASHAEREAALEKLHAIATDGRGGPDEIYTLAELSFLHAEKTGSRPHYLAAAVYAYAYLFPEEGEEAPPEGFDPRLRVACDLYNRALAKAFASRDGQTVELRDEKQPLPFGEIKIEFNPASLHWIDRDLVQFVPMAELEVHGLTNRYRRPGIGAPLAASSQIAKKKVPGTEKSYVAEDLKVPVTALLRIPDARRQLATRALRATLELHTNAETVSLGGRRVPLESEPTAAYAWTLAESRFWEQEIWAFLRGDFLGKSPTRLTALKPYVPGRIPVVLVHGTGSSPGRWADLVNELENDERLRDRIQIWLFRYDTGNMIPYSALLLRRELDKLVSQLDPNGLDPALHRMVLVGHSQGGLLIKMAAIDSGDRLWASLSSRPLDDKLHMSRQTRDLLQQTLFVKPLPFVHRLVYIATPHQGSLLVTRRLSDWLARFVHFPEDIVKLSTDLTKGDLAKVAFKATGRLPTSVDNMAPGNPFGKALAALPVVPGVAAHSIIAVKGDGDPKQGNDGVVKYTSAHVAGVASELVVRSGHSCQSNPEVIDEVRRILLQEVEGK